MRIGPLKPPEMPPTDCYKSQRSTDSRAKITLIDILFTFRFPEKECRLDLYSHFQDWMEKVDCGVRSVENMRHLLSTFY